MVKKLICLLLTAAMLLSFAVGVSAAQKEYTFRDSRGNEVIVPENAFATRVVSTDTGNKWTIYKENKNTDNLIGPPYDSKGKSKTSYCLGNYGSVVLEFSVDIVDNEGMDIYVFEVGNEVEPTRVEVSVDGSEWIFVGNADGALSGVDMAGKVPEGARYHYVRLTDLGTDANYEWPGADVNAVAGLNVKNMPFRVLPLDAYYYGPVTWAYDNGITFGVGDEKFDPDASCKRQDVVTYLWRLNGSPEPETALCPFVDVKKGEYYYDAVLWGYENGVIMGTDATHFSPARNIKRCEFVALLYRNFGNPDYTVSNPFVDVKESEYYFDAVLWAYEVGITKGTDATHFAPEDECTRAQVVTFLYRFSLLEKPGEPEEEKPKSIGIYDSRFVGGSEDVVIEFFDDGTCTVLYLNTNKVETVKYENKNDYFYNVPLYSGTLDEYTFRVYCKNLET